MNLKDPQHHSVRNAVINGAMYVGVLAIFVIWLLYRGLHPEFYAIALLPIELSCFLFALVPVKNLNDRRDLALMRYGIYFSPVTGRVVNFVFGLLLLGLSYYYAF